MPIDNPNVGVAFGLVCGAGAATALGASVVFFPCLVKLASPRVLASGLAVSAGVMMYVSFVDIFPKAQGWFEEAGETPGNAFTYTTFCFFAGVFLMILLDFAIRCLSGKHHHYEAEPRNHRHRTSLEKSECAAEQLETNPQGVLTPKIHTHAVDPTGDLEAWQHLAKHQDDNTETKICNKPALDIERDGGLSETPFDVAPESAATPKLASGKNDEDSSTDEESTSSRTDEEKASSRKLVSMGMHTALAIALHNFPEGLATFVTTLDDPKVGALLAVAIAIHNIPEGLCVALPIYYATGQRWKAFLWACVSGISEPIAALFGWVILANAVSDQAYAILFGIVGGMMVLISVKELLPTAHRYDPEDTVVTYSFIGGMFVLALSLVLFVV